MVCEPLLCRTVVLRNSHDDLTQNNDTEGSIRANTCTCVSKPIANQSENGSDYNCAFGASFIESPDDESEIRRVRWSL